VSPHAHLRAFASPATAPASGPVTYRPRRSHVFPTGFSCATDCADGLRRRLIADHRDDFENRLHACGRSWRVLRGGFRSTGETPLDGTASLRGSPVMATVCAASVSLVTRALPPKAKHGPTVLLSSLPAVRAAGGQIVGPFLLAHRPSHQRLKTKIGCWMGTPESSSNDRASTPTIVSVISGACA